MFSLSLLVLAVADCPHLVSRFLKELSQILPLPGTMIIIINLVLADKLLPRGMMSPESSEFKAPEIWKDVFHHRETHHNPAPISHCWIKPTCQGGAGKEAVELVNRSRRLIVIIIISFFGFI